ncbi:hypothetical protein E3E11_06515 [Oecophyllibacter saccharovorans]|uniref:hypothetical protein n=1 Tax=Oecophyllibacter saccharovorans TaxID=2558360 RepID=UPI00114392B3|nr:hypothetical protein [Oecophyllibacter saccharovorans]QDH15557.1 hypothetical protein E3E11_06515 [Oecophyllibacter saccharovorans]
MTYVRSVEFQDLARRMDSRFAQHEDRFAQTDQRFAQQETVLANHEDRIRHTETGWRRAIMVNAPIIWGASAFGSGFAQILIHWLTSRHLL